MTHLWIILLGPVSLTLIGVGWWLECRLLAESRIRVLDEAP